MVESKQSFADIIKGEKPVLVDFYADWCGPCKMMAPVLSQLSKELGDRIKIIKIDVDQNPQAAAAYQIQGIPTMILFKGGNILWRQSGALPAHQLKQSLQQYL